MDAAQEPAPVYMNAVSDPKKCWTEPDHSGGLTQYDRTPQGNCGEPWPADDMYAAISTADYNNSAVCGMCVEIDGRNGGKGIVHVSDQCPVGAMNPKCVSGHIDLSHTAFAKIAPGDTGEVPNDQPVKWRYVPCQVTGPIVYHFDAMTQQYWLAVQIRNSRYGIKNIEYRDADGSWKSLALAPINLRITFSTSHRRGC